MKQIKLVVIIGRFQCDHSGHMRLFKKAAEISDNILVLIGSAGNSRTIKNPFTYTERARNLSASVSDELGIFLDTQPLNDNSYNEAAWIEDIQAKVKAAQVLYKVSDDDVTLIGHKKKGDKSTYYLDMFPQWSYQGINDGWQDREMDATAIRKYYFSEDLLEDHFIKHVVSDTTFQFLRDFRITEDYQRLKDDYDYYEEYKKQWASSPFPPKFITVDAFVVCCGHLLMIQRGNAPGRGQWALPGGFLEDDEFIASGIVRELVEETKLKVPTPVLHGSMKHIEVFDNPGRSIRGRVVTHCGLIVLRNDTSLPEVRGADDAAKAKWIPLSVVADEMEEKTFDDHYEMIVRMKNLIK